MAEVLNVVSRSEKGSASCRRLRRAGKIPAVLYGRGANVDLTLDEHELMSAVRHHSKLVELKGAVNESALMKSVQWIALGSSVLHVDLTRVSATDRIETTVAVQLRGEAPGSKEGGVVQHILHELRVECPVMAIPESVRLSVAALKLGSNLTAADVVLPEGVKLLSDPAAIVVICSAPVEADETPAVAEVGEPEVIGRKPKEEEGDEEAEG